MTTNETPYRIKRGDSVVIVKPSVVSLASDHALTVQLNSAVIGLNKSDVQLISRADGVPAERAVDLQKENDELRQSNAECIDEINELAHNCNEFRADRDELRKELAAVSRIIHDALQRFSSTQVPSDQTPPSAPMHPVVGRSLPFPEYLKGG